MRKKLFIAVILLGVITILFPTKASASYNYSPWQEAIESAHSMSISKIVDNVNIRDVNNQKVDITFDDLRDSFVYEDKVYVSDAKQNKIYVLDNDFNYLEQYPKADSDVTLNTPIGIFVTNDLLYVADSENNRIVIFDLDTKEVIQTVQEPNDDIFKTVRFRPQRLVVDRSGRMLVVAQDIFEGIMEFDPSGVFTRYYGTNTVQMSFFEALVYKLSTKKQREKMALKLQASFTNLDIDDYGYVYTVSRIEASNPVKKLNFKGKDILLNNGYINIVGDATFEETNKRVLVGPSSIIDIASNSDNNRYSILDNKRGRIFTYDIEGHLLYISGQIGTQNNMLQGPTSVTYFGEKILVTDNVTKSIVVFEPTRFGELINSATKAYYEMDYETARVHWQEVISENSNYFLAYAGIGKTDLRRQDYKQAITNLKLGHDYYNYSKAYQEYRNQQLKKSLPFVIIVVFIATGYGLYKSIRHAIVREGDEE